MEDKNRIVTGGEAFEISLVALTKLSSSLVTFVMTDLATKEIIRNGTRVISQFKWTLPNGGVVNDEKSVSVFFAGLVASQMFEAISEHNSYDFMQFLMEELGKLKCEFVRTKEQGEFVA